MYYHVSKVKVEQQEPPTVTKVNMTREKCISKPN